MKRRQPISRPGLGQGLRAPRPKLRDFNTSSVEPCKDKMSLDHINAGFEIGGALVKLLDVRQLWRDRAISGVHWATTVFFGGWGIFNLVYYPQLGQPASFAGAIGLVVVNTAWLVLAIRFGALRKC